MRAAFFDVDGTLASSNVASCYIHLQLHGRGRVGGILWLLLFAPRLLYYWLIDRLDRSLFTRRFFGNYRGVAPSRMERWIETPKGGDGFWRGHLFPEALRRIERHRQQGERIVLASGGVEQALIPLARLVSADYMICARLEQTGGRFTGRLEAGSVVGEAKAQAVRRLATEAALDLEQSYAYGDSYSDREFLQCVGHPVAVNADRALRRLAQAEGWPILSWQSAATAPSEE